MRLRRKALYILLVSVCMAVWLATEWSSGTTLRIAVYRNKQLLCDSISQKIVKVRDFETKFHKTKFTEQPKKNATASLFKLYDPKKQMSLTLADDHNEYFLSTGTLRCLIEGTANVSLNGECTCKRGWHGPSCSYPDIVNEGSFKNPGSLRLRLGAPRRVIYGMTFNIEFEQLEIRLREMGDLIDMIVVLESNYTGYGKPKSLFLLDKLRSGFLQEYHHKLLYLFLDFFPTGTNPKDGAFTDFYMKSYPSRVGLRYINGTRKDDIFIVADADEVHRREALLFLKLHDGYPEPFGVIMRRNVFGYFWSSGETLMGIGCSLDMLDVVYNNRCGELRGATSSGHTFLKQLDKYKNKTNSNVQMWQFGKSGSSSNIGGWHCSWCFEPDRVRTKLLSAFNYDFPRWGSFPEKTKVDYIRDLIRVGLWFDEKSTYKPQYLGLHPPYAPSYVLNNMERYQNILFNPYRDM